MTFSDSELELQLLAWQYHNPAKVLPLRKERLLTLFADEVRRELSELLWDYYLQYQTRPTEQAVQIALRHKYTDVAKRAALDAQLVEVMRVPAPVALDQVLDHLGELQLRRATYDLIVEVASELDTASGRDLVRKLSSRTAELQVQILTTTTVRTSWCEDAEARVDRYERARTNPENVGIPWGIKSMDGATGRLMPSWLVVFYARPGVGKSRLMLNTAYNQARAGFLVQYFSLEMPHDMVDTLLDSREAALDYQQILRGELSDEDYEQYRRTLRRIRQRSDVLEVVDVARQCSTAQIEYEMQLFAAKHGRHPDVVYVDHAGLVYARRRTTDKYDNFGAVARELRELARAYGTVVIAAMHRNRASMRQPEAGIEGIYGTDEAGQHAEIIVLLEQDPIDAGKGVLHLTWQKNRYGATGVTTDLISDWASTYVGDAVVTLASRSSTDPLNANNPSDGTNAA